MRRHGGGILAGLLMLAGCAMPTSRLVVVPQSARLTIDLSHATRHVLETATSLQHWQVDVDGPDLGKALTQTVNEASATLQVTLPAVPVGDRRLIELQPLDASGTAVPGGEYAIATAVHSGANALSVSGETTATALVYKRILADDRAKGTKIASALDLTALDAAVLSYARTYGAPEFSLIDTGAIAGAIEAGQGAVPSPQPGFVDNAGQVLIEPTDLPVGVGYQATVRDPSSWSVHSDGAGPLLIPSVVPGTWTLEIVPDGGGIGPITQSVTVGPGATVKVPISVATSKQDASLPQPLAPAIGASLTLGGVPGYAALGGVTYAGGTAENASNTPDIYFTSFLSYTASQGWQVSPIDLGLEIIQAAATVYNNQFYFFGGLGSDGAIESSAVAVAPSANASPQPLPGLPGGVPLYRASAAAVGNTIYVAGGITDASGTANPQIFAFNPVGNTWQSAALPNLSPSRSDMASAVVGTSWYLFGGLALGDVYENGASTPTSLLTPRNDVSIFSGGQWHTGSTMPTARSGAATLVLNGQIYVIGGAGEYGLPSRAVEVYDPVKDTWSVRPPLRVGRENPMVFARNGKIVVAGGLAGSDPTQDQALADVEELTP